MKGTLVTFTYLMKYLKFDFQVSLRSFSSCFDFEIPLFENKNQHKQKSLDLRNFAHFFPGSFGFWVGTPGWGGWTIRLNITVGLTCRCCHIRRAKRSWRRFVQDMAYLTFRRMSSYVLRKHWTLQWAERRCVDIPMLWKGKRIWWSGKIKSKQPHSNIMQTSSVWVYTLNNYKRWKQWQFPYNHWMISE